jgi:DNA-binding SARP family transcriptional activator/tetratricopeptide (TPR) repeat protein
MSDSHASSAFSFQVLGPLEIRWGSELVLLPTAPRVLRLLAVLLLNAPHFVTIESLDHRVLDGDTIKSETWYTYIAQARKPFNPAGSRMLERQGRKLRLNIDPQTIDMVRFLQLKREAGTTAGRDDGTAVRLLKEALACWHGEPLEGLGPGVWLDERRTWLTGERRVTVLLLCQLELRSGDRAAALNRLQQVFSDEPAEEDVAYLLAIARYAEGDRKAALRAYEIHADHVRRGLGAEPSPRMLQLRAEIVAGSLDVRGLLGDGRQTATAGPQTLRAALPRFVGRRRELAQLDRLAERNRVIVLDGPPGVGKTALATQWAYQVADRYPDGRLYLDLQGFGPGGRPLDEAVVLRQVLTRLGVKRADIEPDPDDRADQLARLVAGRRILLILDNAFSAEQVRRLIPAGPGSLVLVASRRRLPGLGVSHQAAALSLALPDEADARDLLLSYLGDESAYAAADVDAIVAWSHRMPLALAVVGSRATHERGRSLPDILRELRARLGDEFADADPYGSVSAALSWCAAALSEPDRRTFRVLGLHPGPDADVLAVAALAGVSPQEAVRSLDALVAVRLADRVSARYAVHDVIREYAAATLPADEAVAAHRLLDFYLHSGDHLATLLRGARQPMSLDPLTPGVVPFTAAGPAEAIDWFRNEYAVLIRLIPAAAELGFPAYAWRILSTMIDFLDWQGRRADWRDASALAMAVAERSGDRIGLARATRSMGRALVASGLLDEGRKHLDRALDLYAELDDPDGLMRVHHDLGDLLIRQGKHTDALFQARASRDLAQTLGNIEEEANGLGALAWCYYCLRDDDAAVEHAQQAITLHQAGAFGRGEAAAQDTLGAALLRQGHPADARPALERSLQLCRQSGDRVSEAEVLDHLAGCLSRLHDQEAAAMRSAAADARRSLS